MAAISWKRYDDELHLSDVLTEAARACVDAKAANPTEFLTAYFRSVSKGDLVQEVSCQPLFSLRPDNEGMRVSLRLFTNIEATCDASPLMLSAAIANRDSAEADVIDAREAYVRALVAVVVGDVQKSLLPVGVHHLGEWDTVLRNCQHIVPSVPPSSAGLPCALQHALSMAAAIAAAKSVVVPVYSVLRSLCLSGPPYTLQPNAVRAAAASGEETFALPQLLLPFFGRAAASDGAKSTATAPAGSVQLDTLYLMPGPSRATDPRGVLEGGCASFLPRLLHAYRTLQARAAASSPLAGSAAVVREDGAVVMDDFENLVDAIDLAVEAVRSAGLEPGMDVYFGLRLRCPVTFSPSFGQSQNAEPQSTAAADPATSVKDSSKKAAAGGGASKKSAGAGKQGAAQVEDIMYSLFTGDADVTSSQLSVYVHQQVTAANGLVAFVQDVHACEDVAGSQRLQALLGASVCVSCRAPFEANASLPRDECLHRAKKEKWCADVCLSPMEIGTLSALFSTVAQAKQQGRSVTLCAPATATDQGLVSTVDIALSVQARHVILAGLATSAGTQALSRYMTVMERLQQQRSLTDRQDEAVFYPDALPGFDAALVPEIKRKTDKRKRKGR